jgi:hypothetical protein
VKRVPNRPSRGETPRRRRFGGSFDDADHRNGNAALNLVEDDMRRVGRDHREVRARAHERIDLGDHVVGQSVEVVGCQRQRLGQIDAVDDDRGIAGAV